MTNENRGVKIPIIGIPGLPGEKDYIVGASSKIPYEIRCSNWELFLSDPRDQFNKKTDTQGCVSFSATVEGIEMQMNWMLAADKFSARQIEEMKALGYMKDGKFRFSPLFLANISGTDSEGNSQNVVAETIRKYGMVAESDYPFTSSMTWNEAYRKVPLALREKALKFFKYVSISYEWVVTNAHPVTDYKAINAVIKRELLHAPLQFTAPLCPSYYAHDDVIKSCPLVVPVHAMLIYGLRDDNGSLTRLAFDTYPPYKKAFANNYPIPYIMKIVATAVPNDEIYDTEENIKFHEEHPELSPEVTKDVFHFRSVIMNFIVKLFTGKDRQK